MLEQAFSKYLRQLNLLTDRQRIKREQAVTAKAYAHNPAKFVSVPAPVSLPCRHGQFASLGAKSWFGTLSMSCLQQDVRPALVSDKQLQRLEVGSALIPEAIRKPKTI